MMKLPRRQFLHLAAGAVAIVLVTLFGHTAWSQTARTIKIIVPFPAGGVADTLARMLADQVGRAQGALMVVENRAGAGSVIGTEAAARAAPDGNTVLITSNTLLTNPHLRKVGYDALTSFDPICYLSRVPYVIAVNSTSRYHTLADFIEAARTKPGDLTLATTTAGMGQIAFEMLKRTADVKMTFVPYAGDAPAVSALLGEHVTSVLFTYAAVAPQVSAGKLRVLATVSPARIVQLPDVPTIAESGFGEIEADGWYGLFAPTRTPMDMRARLASWFSTALHAPEVKAKLAVLGHDSVAMCGAEFAVYLHKKFEEYGRVIREASIKAE
jgi:tripartite-type tricarboxylate transporter receptor subunit TctC